MQQFLPGFLLLLLFSQFPFNTVNAKTSCPTFRASIIGSCQICQGKSTTIFFNFDGGQPPYSIVYQVENKDGTKEFKLQNIYNGHQLAVRPNESSHYKLLQVKDRDGCPGKPVNSAIVQLKNNIPDPTIPAPVIACEVENGDNVFNLTTIENEIRGGLGYLVNWYLDPGLNVPILNTTTFATSGNITLYATLVEGTCESIAVPVFLIVQPNPVPVIMGNTVLCPTDNLVLSVAASFDTYEWSPINANGPELVVPPDNSGNFIPTYYVTVFDAAGCQGSDSIEVELVTMDLICIELSPASSPTASDGFGRVTISGGSPPFQGNWDGPGDEEGDWLPSSSNNLQLQSKPPGDYFVEITDDCNIVRTCTLTIGPVCGVELIISDLNNPSCIGNDDGSISVEAVGSHTGLEFGWDSGDFGNTPSISGLSAGNYLVTVMDSDGCVGSLNITLTEPNALDLICPDFVSLPLIGSTGTADVTFMGGTPGYRLKWEGGDVSDSMDFLAPGTFEIPDLTHGLYTVTLSLENAADCNTTCSFQVTEPDCSLSISSSSTDVTCPEANDGTISLDIATEFLPYTINWSNGQENMATIEGLPGGIYTASVSDAVECQHEITVEVIEPNPFSIIVTELQADNDPNGGAGIVRIIYMGGTPNYTVFIDGLDQPPFTNVPSGEQMIENLEAGSYTIRLVDSNACSFEQDFEVSDGSCNLSVQVNTFNDPFCAGESTGSIDIEVMGNNGPFSYQWNDNVTSEDRENLPAGLYSVTVTDDLGCSEVTAVELENPAPLNLTCLVIAHDTLSNDETGVVSLGISGGLPGYVVSWNGMDLPYDNPVLDTIQHLSEGTYTFTLTDSNNCTSACTVNINGPECMLSTTCTSSNASDEGVADGSITISIENGEAPYVLNWSGPISGMETNVETSLYTLNNLLAGNYTFTVEDANGCESSAITCQVNVEPDPQFNDECIDATPIILNPFDICNGEALDTLIQFTNEGATPSLPPAPTTCNGDGQLDQPANDVWYTFTAPVNKMKISVLGGLFTPNIVLYEGEDCENLVPFYCFSANQGEGIIEFELETVFSERYYLMVSGGDLEDEGIFFLKFESVPIDNQIFITSDTSTCDGNAIWLKPKTNYTSYLWSTGSTSDSISVSQEGVYAITVLDNQGCEIEAEITLNNFELPIVNDNFIILDNTLLDQEFSIITNDTIPDLENSDFHIIEPPRFGALDSIQQGLYAYRLYTELVGVDSFYYEVCSSNCSFCPQAKVVLEIGFENSQTDVTITPNEMDRLNHTFQLDLMYQFPSPHLKIFDRFGALIYENVDYMWDWSGTNFEGEEVPEGPYYYILDLEKAGRKPIVGYIAVKRT